MKISKDLNKYKTLKIQVLKHNIIRLGEQNALLCKPNGDFSEMLFLEKFQHQFSSLNKFLNKMIHAKDEDDYIIKCICDVLECYKVDLLQIKLYDAD